MIATTVATVLLGLMALWLFGGLALRIGGLLTVLAGAFGAAQGGEPSGLLLVFAGGLLWLAGHWHYALRHQAYKSAFARHFFCRWAPAWLDPTRDWALSVSGRSGSQRRGP